MQLEYLATVQRHWRQRWLDDRNAIAWPAGRDLLAYMLLNLDDPQRCWELLVHGLRDALDADRVDAGVLDGGDPRSTHHWYKACAEVQRASMQLPAMSEIAFDAKQPDLVQIWHKPLGLIEPDVRQSRQLSPSMQTTLLGLKTAAKLAIPLWDGARPARFVCADWTRPHPRWSAQLHTQLVHFVQPLGELLRSIAADAGKSAPPRADALVESVSLSPAEHRVAALIAQGMSYKEVASQLNRSVSTIDHQLRSIRGKLGLRSTSQLISQWRP